MSLGVPVGTHMPNHKGDAAFLIPASSSVGKSGSVLLRARHEAEIYERLCGVLVREGGYLMANVAMPLDDPIRSVQFVQLCEQDCDGQRQVSLQVRFHQGRS